MFNQVRYIKSVSISPSQIFVKKFRRVKNLRVPQIIKKSYDGRDKSESKIAQKLSISKDRL